MVEKLLNVLVIEDNEDDYTLLVRSLNKGGVAVEAKRVQTVETLQQALVEKKWDVVISDNNIPDKRINVNSSMKMARKMNPYVPFIIVSGTIGDENAVKLMKNGANDYILKDNLTRLVPALTRELTESRNKLAKATAEQKLQESEVRYRLLSESINDMFFALDKNLKCTFWNSTAEKISGIPAVEAIGRSFTSIFPKLKYTAAEQRIMECFETMTSATLELEVQFTNVMKYYQLSIYPSSEMHSIIVKDITESRKISRRLKKVNEELETFIYRVSHDIRGPVASIMGLVNLASTEPTADVNGNLMQHVSKMTNRLQDVIKALQEVVRIKEGEPSYTESNVDDIIHSATELIGLQSSELEIEINSNGSTEIVHTDKELLTLAVEKIIANARDFRNPFRPSKLTIDFNRTNDNFYEIRFADNGVGMSTDVQEKIFTMFYRGSTRSSGSGLGLYLAASAIEKLEGSIVVNSIANEGSVFTIVLPVGPRKARFADNVVSNLFRVVA